MAHEDTISHLGVSLLCACTKHAAAVIAMAMIVVCRRYRVSHPFGRIAGDDGSRARLLGASTKREADSKNYKTIYFY